ncbi:hypothetical protein [Mangrovimonas sp. TPBH4]|uniref:hypothetical protein n=1 Tax=Mangrovimonas sp. TPBH4 TaxID=1645914 RepID=UPI0006B4A08E|nr:hypothetical protein [Mangrovimonas sp. TPBH4]
MKQLFLKILLGLIALLISGGITLLWMNYMTEMFTTDMIKYSAVGAFQLVGMLVVYHYLKRMVCKASSKTS